MRRKLRSWSFSNFLLIIFLYYFSNTFSNIFGFPFQFFKVSLTPEKSWLIFQAARFHLLRQQKVHDQPACQRSLREPGSALGLPYGRKNRNFRLGQELVPALKKILDLDVFTVND